MLQYIIGVLIKELVAALTKAATDYVKLQHKKKEDKILVKEVMREKDPKVRASRIRDLLS